MKKLKRLVIWSVSLSIVFNFGFLGGLINPQKAYAAVFLAPVAGPYAGDNTSTASLSNMATSNNSYGNIKSDPVDEFFHTNHFDTSLITGVIADARLKIEYRVDSGYNGTGKFLVGSDGISTGITPLSSETSDVTKQFDIFATGFDTIGELASLDIKFTNNDTGSNDNVKVDLLTLDITTVPNPPIVTAPAGLVMVNADNYTIQGTAQAGSTVTIYRGVSVVASGTATGGVFNIPTPLIQDSVNNFTVTAGDADGESTPTPVPPIIEDSTAPISLVTTSGTYGPNTWPGSIEGTASDNLSGVASVSLEIRRPDNQYWNGAIWQMTSMSVAASGTNNWSYVLNVSNLIQNGIYVIISRATDAEGNVESTGIGAFAWDGDAPLDDPSNFTSTPDISVSTDDNTIQVSWATGGTDTLSGVDGYSYSFTQGELDTPNAVKDIEENINSVVSSALSPDGSWWFHIRTIDNAGNWTATAHYGPFLIDTTAPSAPTIDPVVPLVDADSQIITGTAEADSLIIITGGTGTVSQQLTGGETNYSINVPLIQDAANNLSVTAADTAGNTSDPTTVIIMEDSTAPISPPAVSASVADGKVNLSWGLVTDADHYEIWRSSSLWVIIATVPGNQNTYTDTGVERGRTYQYKIVAVDEAGNGSIGALISILVPALSPISILPVVAQAAGPTPALGVSTFPSVSTSPSPSESVSPSPSTSGTVQGEESKGNEETNAASKYKFLYWLIPLIIIILLLLFWWRRRRDEDDEYEDSEEI